MKYLVVGLGNPGDEYAHTRHNIGFDVLDDLAKSSNTVFSDKRYGWVASMSLKNKEVVLIKPSTFMNLSGNAVRYWMQQLRIPLENLLIIVDDLALPFGSIRLKPRGSDAGHNGLKHIQQILGTDQYARIRFGIGSDYPKGGQINYVLGHFEPEQQLLLPERIEWTSQMVKSFILSGIDITMNQFNKK